MKILDKYLFTQILWSFLFGLAVVIIVWITPELLPNTVRDVVANKMTAMEGFLLILYELPEVLVKSLPMGMLIGSLLVFDKLSKDSEITAMRACGIGIYRMLLSIVIIGIAGTIISFTINELLVPSSTLAQDKIRNKGKTITSHFTYVDKDKNDILKQVVLIDYYDGKTIKNVRILSFLSSINSSESNLKNIYAAATAHWKDNHWVLHNGISYDISKFGIYEKTVIFDNKKIESNPRAFELLNKSLRKPKHMNIFETKDYIDLLNDSDQLDEARYFKVRFNQKFSQPFAAIILGVLGLILGIHPPRTSRFIGYTVGMFVILLYYFVWPVAMALGNIGTIPPVLAAWLPNIIAIVIGVIVLKYKDF